MNVTHATNNVCGTLSWEVWTIQFWPSAFEYKRKHDHTKCMLLVVRYNNYLRIGLRQDFYFNWIGLFCGIACRDQVLGDQDWQKITLHQK